MGPNAVLTQEYGLVTGRVTALALDPSDATGNRLFLGTTGGGVWATQSAASSNVVFAPLTDTVAALNSGPDASISIGALTVQPGGTGVILAGTGDPNDALDSYYGAGILRSANGGNTWSVIASTSDGRWSFAGEGFAGFAWSTTNPQQVVAAVSQAYEGTLVGSVQPGASYQGLYYSSDAGATWSLATITDGGGSDIQGPNDTFAQPDGNAATSVVWNARRRLFVAAVRFHGYYQSADGVTWTRMAAQPGSGLTTLFCPTNPASTGSTDCPIFRGTLAVNPVTGDTFAWTVDLNNQDQGLWQDLCSLSGGNCTNQTISFAKQWNTAPLETSTGQGAATIGNGDYNLALAAVPSGQDTLLLVGANDLWQCSLAMGCAWRNTTNANTCMSAQVAGYQHALAWNAANPLEVFLGNDSGIWRSMDAIGETGSVCSSSDASHFQNLNGSLGSLAEVESLAQASETPYTMMAGLGVNGTAGVKLSATTAAAWPQILDGEGGPVAIDPTASSNWYVNNQAGVSIHGCSQTAACAPADFGVSPAVTDADVGGDGQTMTVPATFLVDPLDPSQLLIGTCRVWRGPANGAGWTSANAISSILDGGGGASSCSGDALIRSMAAMKLAGGQEVVYLGMYGALDGGATLAGHVWSATFNPSGAAAPAWNDLTLSPVSNGTQALNPHGMDISSIFIDSHDATGNTVYVTIAGMENPRIDVETVYRSTDGGAHWTKLTSNLPWAPANSLVVDPQDANTVYIATDAGVYSTRQIATCADLSSTCWSAMGSGLPQAPVVQLIAAPAEASAHILTAATYGRGVWQTPLWTAGENLTAATATPASLTFGSQPFGSASSAQPVTLVNTGNTALMATSVQTSGDFSETDNCLNAILPAGASCTVEVTFIPSQTGSRTGQLTISANISGGQLSVALSGTGVSAGVITLTPPTVDFGTVQVQTTSAALQIAVNNTGALAAPVASVAISPPFAIAGNGCGSSLAANSTCQLKLTFAPTQVGAAVGTLTYTDADGTQTVHLTGSGATAPTDALSASSLSFSPIVEGQVSAAQTVTLTNSGGMALTGVVISASGAFGESDNCGAQLAANASCTISVAFAPNQTGPLSGTLTVVDALRSQTIALSGTGLAPPTLSVSPTNLTFAAQPGVASPQQTLTVSNGSGTPAANIGFQVAGQSASSFALGSTTCGALLASGSSCTAQVTFTPVALGAATATLTVSSSTPDVAGVTVPLSGTGFDFTVTSSGSTSQTVASGQTATYALVISPMDSLPGTFVFQCPLVPSNLKCTFSSNSETIAAGASGNVTVQIATGADSALAQPVGGVGWRALPVACGLLLPLALRRRGMTLLLAVLLAAVAGGLSSCAASGGSFSTGPGGGTTQESTFSIPVTATCNNVQHTLTLTLTVD